MFTHATSSIFLITLAATKCQAQAQNPALKINSGTPSASPGLGVNHAAKNATADVTPGAGPNGSEDWLNSGIKGNGWTAPYLNFSTVLHVDRPTFYGHVGAPCKEYDQFFQVGGDGHGIDPVILAFIAMQESSCNADAGGPTPGLMQVSCENYPNGVCTDSIQDNVNAGANYLRGRLDAANNNAIKAIGSYNGWFTAGQGLNGNRGLTEGYPCSAEGKSNGEPQNLNYLMQTLNGWFLGLDVYGDQNWIGKYKCQGNCDNGNIC